MSFFQNIQHRLLGNVQYKISLIFCSIYVVLFFGKTINYSILFYLTISILLSFGIAGLGYAMNDIKDYKDDLKNNKPNLFNKFSKLQSVVLVVLFILLSIFPWLYLPIDKNSIYLLSIELLLFFMYAFPPFRLKEKGIFGIITDALYAQVIPCLLAIYTFSKIADTKLDCRIIAIYSIWLFFVGVRNIIKHQVEDINNDYNTKTKTLATIYGINFLTKISTHILFPIEFILFIILLITIKTPYFIILLSFILYIIFLLFKMKNNKDTDVFHFINTRIFNEFYEIHLPIILFICFSYFNTIFIIILVFNLLIFSSIYLSYVKGFLNKYLNN